MLRSRGTHRMRTALIAIASGATLIAAPIASMSPASAVPVMQARYEMNEPANATRMNDTSGNGLNAPINQAGLDTGVSFGGAVGYSWAFRSPTAPPPSPERVISVPDNSKLDPLGDTFTVEIRYRTSQKFGNIIQKGQSTDAGGQWKFQNPGGKPSCLFKGPGGSAGVQSINTLNNNQWHTLKCVRTPSNVTLYVDGVFQGRKNGATGTINNSRPMTIGGKGGCNQTTITCDYFTGQIDYVRITRGT